MEQSNSNDVPLTLRTVYAELLDRAASAALHEAFTEKGNFTAKRINGRTYWYFQAQTADRRQQRYVGPETPELLEHIKRHKNVRDDINHRAKLVSTLVRSAYLPRPQPEIGTVLAALAKAGVFRLRAVLIGTAAYQTYSSMLGVRLPASGIQTGDIDIAQSREISIAVKDTTPPMLEVLRDADASFREIPHAQDGRRVATYEAQASGIRVDFLTPNEGADSEAPRELPALNTDAQPLRFLAYLIRDPEPAAALHGAGIYVLVPAPERYAIHKLIVSRRRREGNAKSDKDILQAEALLFFLIDRRPFELKAAWAEAWGRGKKWRQLIGEGMAFVAPLTRDRVLKTVEMTRSIIPGLEMQFASSARYDFERDVVTFTATANNVLVRCAVSREALDDHFGADGLDKDGRLKIFRENRTTFEKMARTKYMEWPIDMIYEGGQVLIRTEEVPQLLKTALGRKDKN
jgi:hypothetical protein